MEDLTNEIDKLSLIKVKFSVDTTVDMLGNVLKALSQAISLFDQGTILSVHEINYVGHDWLRDEKYIKSRDNK